jgi:hypothetical protein
VNPGGAEEDRRRKAGEGAPERRKVAGSTRTEQEMHRGTDLTHSKLKIRNI